MKLDVKPPFKLVFGFVCSEYYYRDQCHNACSRAGKRRPQNIRPTDEDDYQRSDSQKRRHNKMDQILAEKRTLHDRNNRKVFASVPKRKGGAYC